MATTRNRNASLSTAQAASIVLEDDTSGDTSTLGDVGFEQGDTSDAEAVINSQKLGPSAVGRPIGMPKTVKIILEEGAENEIPPTGLPVSLNGKAYLIRPGEEVNLPLGVLEILDNAVMSVPVKDPQTMKVVGYRKRLRFPYRLVR